MKPRECIVNAGELLFVPRGWWHMALNLEVRFVSPEMNKAFKDCRSASTEDTSSPCGVAENMNVP